MNRRCSEVGATTDSTMTLSVAEEVIAPSAGNNRACSNGGSREDKHSSGERSRARIVNGGSSEMRPLCHRDR